MWDEHNRTRAGYSIISKQARKCVARTRYVNTVRMELHSPRKKKNCKILSAESSVLSVRGGGREPATEANHGCCVNFCPSFLPFFFSPYFFSKGRRYETRSANVPREACDRSRSSLFSTFSLLYTSRKFASFQKKHCLLSSAIYHEIIDTRNSTPATTW